MGIIKHSKHTFFFELLSRGKDIDSPRRKVFLEKFCRQLYLEKKEPHLPEHRTAVQRITPQGLRSRPGGLHTSVIVRDVAGGARAKPDIYDESLFHAGLTITQILHRLPASQEVSYNACKELD